MSIVAKNYFFDLFQRKISVMEPVLSIIMRTITNEDNIHLTTPFNREEFREAIFSMHPNKCLGPDGFIPGFYQHFWNICSEDIMKDCCFWLDTGQFPASLNSRNIVLIP